MSLLDNLPDWVRGNRLLKVEPLDDVYDAKGEKKEQTVTDADIQDANIVTSEYMGNYHIPLIDIDMDAALLPSTTKGHYHLYINKPMSKEDLFRLLTVMTEVGIVQPGYLEHSQKRGYTALRLPHVKKNPPKFEELPDVPF